MEPDKTLRMSLLYDFFGDLLTEKQKEYFNLHYNEDLSLSEIAETAGISRQGVRDIIVRAENQLMEMEEKTGIVRRFSEMQRDLAALQKAANGVLLADDLDAAKEAARRILAELEHLRS